MKNKWSAALQLTAALLLVVSMVWEISDRIHWGLFRPIEYFSYVTIQVCMFAIFVCSYHAISLLRNRAQKSWLSWAQLMVVSYMAIIAVIYNTMLRGLPLSPLDAPHPWPDGPNEIMHVAAPAVILVNWFVMAGTLKIDWSHVWCILYYSIGWGVVTIANGIIGGWWPYWFMNPKHAGGPWGVTAYLVSITAFMVAVGYLFIWLEHRVRTANPTSSARKKSD